MTVEYTTQHTDLYGSAESLQMKIKALGITIQGLNLADDDDDGYNNKDWVKGALAELISDLERHAIAIKHAICDLDRKLGGTVL